MSLVAYRRVDQLAGSHVAEEKPDDCYLGCSDNVTFVNLALPRGVLTHGVSPRKVEQTTAVIPTVFTPRERCW